MSDTVELFRLTSIEQLSKPSVRAFIAEALATNKLIVDPGAALLELGAGIAAPSAACVIGHEGGKWSGFVLLQASLSAFNPAVVVVHFYNTGSTAMRKALVEWVAGFADATGHRRIIGVDANDAPKAFARLFSAVGEPEMTGQMVVFNRERSLL